VQIGVVQIKSGMGFELQLLGAAIGTGLLYFGSGPLLARVLRFKGRSNVVTEQLGGMVLRLLLAVLLALGIGLSGAEARVALVFTVGAAYFAAAVINGLRQFRKRESEG
jgi:hypothetical protein